MISLASSIHTNVDQSATFVQPKERVDSEEKVALKLSQDPSGHNKEQQSSDHFTGQNSRNQQKDVEFKASPGDVVNLYSKKPQIKSEDGEGGKIVSSEEAQKSQESRLVSELKRRDAEVRQHELAHAQVGGAHAGAPQYKFVKGPDGKNYAVEGEVSVNVSFSGGAEEKLEKARTVRAAALAPSEPSSQDRQVAAQAARVAMQAQTELVKLKAQEKSENPVLGDEALIKQSDETLSTQSILGNQKVTSNESRSDILSKETQPILGGNKLEKNKLEKEMAEKNKTESLLSAESEDSESEIVSQKEKAEKEKTEASASTKEAAESESRFSSVSKAEKSSSNSQTTSDESSEAEPQEASQSVSVSGSHVDEVSVFLEAQSKMLASYDQVVRSGEYINENSGGLFKYSELNVLA